MKKRHSTFSTSASSYNLRGGMFLGNFMNSNMPWNILMNKLALIGKVSFDCESSCGDCWFFFFFLHQLHMGFMEKLNYTLIFQ